MESTLIPLLIPFSFVIFLMVGGLYAVGYLKISTIAPTTAPVVPAETSPSPTTVTPAPTIYIEPTTPPNVVSIPSVKYHYGIDGWEFSVGFENGPSTPVQIQIDNGLPIELNKTINGYYTKSGTIDIQKAGTHTYTLIYDGRVQTMGTFEVGEEQTDTGELYTSTNSGGTWNSPTTAPKVETTPEPTEAPSGGGFSWTFPILMVVFIALAEVIPSIVRYVRRSGVPDDAQITASPPPTQTTETTPENQETSPPEKKVAKKIKKKIVPLPDSAEIVASSLQSKENGKTIGGE